MHNVYINSPDVIIRDTEGRTVADLAVYDDTLLPEYIRGVTLKGREDRVEGVKASLYRFLELWEKGERSITIRIGEFNLTSYSMEYIEPSPKIIPIGERPENPRRDLQFLAESLSRSLQYGQFSATSIYQELQNFVSKHPTLPVIKEKA